MIDLFCGQLMESCHSPLMLTVGSLFAGVGGFDSGFEEAGWKTFWQVEREPFCLAVLKTRFPHAMRATDIRTCRGLTSSVPESRARTYRSQVNELDLQESAQSSFMSLRESLKNFDPLGFSSRMFPDFSVQTKEETLQKSSGFSWSSAGMGFAGVSLTASFSESPNEGAVCSLSDVLESHVPQRFFLSAVAARGILKRADDAGKTLPTRLERTLRILATKGMAESIPRSSASNQAKPTPASGTTKAQASPASMKHQSSSEQMTMAGMSATTLAQRSDAEESAEAESTPRSASHRTSGESSEQAASVHSSPAAAASQEKGIQRYLSPTLSTKNEVVSSSTQREKWMEQCAEMLMTVRRLTPTECEVLQGFPKGWTLPGTEHWGTRSRKRSRNGLQTEF
jgi:site-specific DNA-cytosine methylase